MRYCQRMKQLFLRVIYALELTAIVSVFYFFIALSAARASDSYETLEEPVASIVDVDAERSAYETVRSDAALEAYAKQLIRNRKSQTAWDIIEAHGDTGTKPYFEAKLAAVNARMAEVGKLAKLAWAHRLNETCSTRAVQAPDDETALECLAKFHNRAPIVAGGDKDVGAKALADLIRTNPARGYLVKAEIVFPKDPDAARALVDKALSYDDVYDEGLMQAAMVYGYFKDWDAVQTTLARVPPDAPNAQMRHYQVGKLSAQFGERLDWGEEALITFLQGDTLYYGVDFRGPAHWRLGQIFQHGERYVLAKSAFERALSHNSTLSGAKRDLKAVSKRLKRGR